ncbi:mCG144937, partial [Mus musculus]
YTRLPFVKCVQFIKPFFTPHGPSVEGRETERVERRLQLSMRLSGPELDQRAKGHHPSKGNKRHRYLISRDWQQGANRIQVWSVL